MAFPRHTARIAEDGIARHAADIKAEGLAEPRGPSRRRESVIRVAARMATVSPSPDANSAYYVMAALRELEDEDRDPRATTAVVTSDEVHPDELLPEGAGPDWRVANIDIVRDGVTLATLQVTPIDIVVFPGSCHDIGVIRNGERATVTERSVGIYGATT